MADIMEMAKALGKALQQDETYLNFRAAAEQNDSDGDLQQLIAEFNRGCQRSHLAERTGDDDVVRHRGGGQEHARAQGDQVRRGHLRGHRGQR